MLTRLVNGIRTELSAEEEAAVRAEWAAEAAKPAPVPDASPLQLYDELDQTHGIDLDDEIGRMSQKALKRFRIANTIRRIDPFITGGLQPKLGWTDEQVDALFRAAAAR